MGNDLPQQSRIRRRKVKLNNHMWFNGTSIPLPKKDTLEYENKHKWSTTMPTILKIATRNVIRSTPGIKNKPKTLSNCLEA
ncbi:hypothetical protein TNCV_2322291 [Trichonephila clavipes]|nr:hypothetical protein TNCV_2322291 [Trichonephila clavipes]